MGFDKDDTRPVVDVKKRTTKVNISLVIAVVVFLVATGIVVLALSLRHPDAALITVPRP